MRLLWMATLPLADTTEPRYAEIARLMAVTGDWITPWFEPGVPFWGKPPASFWAQAISFRLLDISAFSARLPAWIASLLTVLLIARLRPGYQGVLAAAIYLTMALPYVSAGTVMTDTFLTLGTTLAMSAVIICLRDGASLWGWAFFIGLAIGLLAKGPLTLVLVGIPLLGWLAATRDWRRLWLALPWVSGILLLALLVIPWYLLAELKTPGFLNYFLIGEHFKRFVVSEWAGDLYGSAHDYPRGTIWLHWVLASFPWSIIAFAIAARRWLRRWPIFAGLRPDPDRLRWLLLAAALTPPFFFTFAGNILWTYVLPGLPFAALLIAEWLQPKRLRAKAPSALIISLLITPLIAGAAGAWFSFHPEALKTEGPMITRINANYHGEDEALTYIGQLPFSARFYSRGQAQGMERDELVALIAKGDRELPAWLAIRRNDDSLIRQLPKAYRRVDENLRHQLFSRVPLP